MTAYENLYTTGTMTGESIISIIILGVMVMSENDAEECFCNSVQSNEKLFLDCFEECDKIKIRELLDRIRIRNKYEELAKRALKPWQ